MFQESPGPKEGRVFNSLAKIHLAVFFFGLSGLFGKLLTLPPPVIVLGRVFFASIFLWLLLIVQKQRIRPQRKREGVLFLFLGSLLALHWVTFFLSIQLSTVSIGLLTFSSFPVFVAFLEPLLSRERFRRRDIGLAFVTFGGVALVLPSFQLESGMTQGALWGLSSGFSFAVLSVLNRKYTVHYDGRLLTFYQCLAATLVLFPLALPLRMDITGRDLSLLLLLGIVFTGFSHSLFIHGLKNVKARTASIIACLEPLYGILATAIFLGEIPPLREIGGGLIILTAAVYATLRGL